MTTKYLPPSIIKLEHHQDVTKNRSAYLIGLSLDCFINPDKDRQSHYFARELCWSGRLKSAVREFQRHIAMNAWPVERAQSMIFIGDCHLALGDIDEAKASWHRAFVMDGSRRESLIRLATQAWKEGDAQRTAAYCEAALTIPRGGFYANDQADYAQKPEEMLYWAYWNLGNFEKSREHWLKAVGYQPLNSKFLYDDRFYIQPELTLPAFTQAIKDGTSFSFVKMGDGELACMRGDEGKTCDGQSYSPELAKALRDAYQYLAGRVHVVHWDHQNDFNMLLHRDDHDNAPVIEFWQAVRDSGRPKAIIASSDSHSGLVSTGTGMVKLFNATEDPVDAFFSTCGSDAFSDYEDIKRRLLKWVESLLDCTNHIEDWGKQIKPILIFAAGPLSKVLIADVLQEYSTVTCLDAGSSFDPLFRGESRTHQLDQKTMREWYGLPYQEEITTVQGVDPWDLLVIPELQVQATGTQRQKTEREYERIPRTLWTIWLSTEPTHPDLVKMCIDSQRAVEGYEHALVDLESPLHADCYGNSRYYQEATDAMNWVKASDYLRMWLLLKYGGIFLDADMEVLRGKNFDPMLNDRMFMGYEFNGWRANSGIGSEPGHPLLAKYLDRLDRNFRGDGDLVFDPGMRLWNDVFYQADEISLGVRMYPTEVFYPYNHHTGERTFTEETLVYHHYQNSWMPKVVVVVPTLGREKQLKECLAAIYQNADYPRYRVVIASDQFGPGNIGVPRLLQKAVGESTEPLVMYLGNDCVPKPGFLKRAVECMVKNYPNLDGLVGLNDGIHMHGENATHWLAGRKLLPLLVESAESISLQEAAETLAGAFFHTGYHHVACDNELSARARKIGKYTWCPEAAIEHHHGPSLGLTDEVYAIGWDPIKVAEDRALLQKRAKELGFEEWLEL